MSGNKTLGVVLSGLCAAALWVQERQTMAQTRDLGNGFRDHGVAAPVARSRGAAATVDGAGRNVILVYLSDHRACTSLLTIDAETGETRQAELFRHKYDSPFAVIQSSANTFLTHFGYTFMEFDPGSGKFSFSGKTDDRVAMSMTEDAGGLIWAATYPNSHVVSYNRDTKELVDHGSLNQETWPQYPRTMAAGRDGWVYIGIGSTYSHIVAYDPKTKRTVPLATADERIKGTGVVLTGADGKVYGQPNQASAWCELRDGKRLAETFEKPPSRADIRTGAQEYVQRLFPDGSRIVDLDVPERFVTIKGPGGGQPRRVAFDYATEGCHVVSLGRGPDDKIYGTTGHPLRLYCYDPATDKMTNHGLLDYNGHWNAVTAMGDKFYGGQYGHGILWEYDPARPWADRDKKAPNPRRLVQSQPVINRPHELLAHPDGRRLVLAGTPGYGHTGGGLHIYDLQTGKAELLGHERLLRDQSTMCLEALPGGLLVGGGTVMPGTGGETLAQEAELYLFDLEARQVVWHEPVLPGVKNIRDLAVGPDGLVYGLADGPTLFVFDAGARKLVHTEEITRYGALAGGQAPRIMLLAPDKLIYACFQKAIVRIEPVSFKHEAVFKSPVEIHVGIALLGDRFYFAAGSHVYSCGQ